MRRAAQRLLSEPRWKQNAQRLRDELTGYHPHELIDAYLADCKVLEPRSAGSPSARHSQMQGLETS
jgi:hypothetical protein